MIEIAIGSCPVCTPIRPRRLRAGGGPPPGHPLPISIIESRYIFLLFLNIGLKLGPKMFQITPDGHGQGVGQDTYGFTRHIVGDAVQSL